MQYKVYMNAEQLSKIKMRSGVGGVMDGPSSHEQTIDRCMFEYKVLAMLRHVVEEALSTPRWLVGAGRRVMWRM